MALGGVFMRDTDGNIGKEISNNTERICGLLFDISGQTNFWTQAYPATVANTFQNTVVEFNTLQDAVDAGIKPFDADSDATSNFLHGIPYYHIKHFFDVAGGSGRLFVMFADCSQDFNALITMQKAAFGVINQFGVWTEKNLWSHADTTAPQYGVRLVGDLDAIATTLANDYNAPVSILLNANSAKVLGPLNEGNPTEITSVDLTKIPTCIISKRYVSVLLSQALDNDVHLMQAALDSKTPVGNVGAALGILSIANVAESIGWVQQYDVVSQFPDIELGFGDCTLTDGVLTNATKYASLNSTQIDTLDDKGYIFLCRYVGYEGHVFFNGDTTCSDGDYRTIARNRVINKSRRGVRLALLKYVNSPIKVDPTTGLLSTTQITIFRNLVSNVLNMMVTANEVSGIGRIEIPADQNILQNDRLKLWYTLVPIGTAKEIRVEEGFALKQQ